MSEWLESLPWGKISTGVIAAVAAALGGSFHLKEDAARIDVASAAQQVQLEEMMRHYGETPVHEHIYIDPLGRGSVQIRLYGSDACTHFYAVRDGAVTSFFLLAPDRIPDPPTLPGHTWSVDATGAGLPLSDRPCPRGRCISPADHGPPVDQEFGPELGNGWRVVWLYYSDACKLETAYHAASGSWVPVEQTRWVCCAERH